MSTTSSRTDLALQISFGIFSILGTIATLASLHHRDSLGCILLRRWLPLGDSDETDDIESLNHCIEDQAARNMTGGEQGIERRTTAPPAYESSAVSETANTRAIDCGEGTSLGQYKSPTAPLCTSDALT